MIGFSEAAKREIAAAKIHSVKESTALLSALIHTAGSLNISSGHIGFSLLTENEQIPPLVDMLTGKLFHLHGEAYAENGGKRLEIRYTGESAMRALLACGILSAEGGVNGGIDFGLLYTPNVAAAYLRGAFLGAGSVTAKRYHLEFTVLSEQFALDLKRLIEGFSLAPKLTVRNERSVVYLKDSQSISDLLALMGAPQAVLRLNNQIAERQVGVYVNRTTNCDIYNVSKQVDASVLQCRAIAYLLERKLLEDDKLLQTAQARTENPNASYEELSQVLWVSKSGLKHRLKKIMEMYRQYQDVENEEGI